MLTSESLDRFRALDRTDPLRSFHEKFDLPSDVIYLDGNSLGALPRTTAGLVAQAVTRDWGSRLIGSWNEAGWIEAPARIGAKIARRIGAAAHEVIVADSTSVNLFKLLAAALHARPGRRVVLSESGNFPTDLYVAEGVCSMIPEAELRVVPRTGLLDAIDQHVAVLMLTHVHYKTGERFDMRAVTALAQARGALALWDLSHSVGAVEVDLNGAGADMAVGCGYKYLNGGPGAPGFLFLSSRFLSGGHQASWVSPLTGWMGHAAPFAFNDQYSPAPGMARFLCGTPPVLGMVALEAGVDLFLEADMTEIGVKSAGLCTALIDLVDQTCAGMGLTLLTPRHPASRGSHVSYRHEAGYAVMQALIARGVIGDFRDPDIIRFGLAPLYVGYEDVWRAVMVLREVLAGRLWDRPEYGQRRAIT